MEWRYKKIHRNYIANPAEGMYYSVEVTFRGVFYACSKYMKSVECKTVEEAMQACSAHWALFKKYYEKYNLSTESLDYTCSFSNVLTIAETDFSSIADDNDKGRGIKDGWTVRREMKLYYV